MKNNKKIITIEIGIIIILIAAITLITKSFNNQIKNITYDENKDLYTCTYKDFKRSFIICLPETCDENTSLVVMLHGMGESAALFKMYTEFEKQANPNNYAVIYIDGTTDPDNKTQGKGWQYHHNKISKTDMNFIIKLCKYCQNKYSLGKRIFVGGFSNGAFMANKLAITYPNIFKGVISVGGMVPKDVWEYRNAKKPVSIIQINGTKDDIVPMEFNGSNKYNPNPSMEKVLEYYAGLNNLTFKDYKTTPLSDLTTLYSLENKIWWILIQDGMHNWPTEQFSKINVNSVIIDFMNKQ